MIAYGIYSIVINILNAKVYEDQGIPLVYPLISSIMIFFPFLVGYIIISRVWHMSLFKVHKIKYRKNLKVEKQLFSIKKNRFVYYVISILLIVFIIPIYFFVENEIIRYILMGIFLLAGIYSFIYGYYLINKIDEFVILRTGKTEIKTYVKKLTDYKTALDAKTIFDFKMYYCDYVGKVKLRFLNNKKEIHYIYILPNDNLLESVDNSFTDGILSYENYLQNISKFKFYSISLKETLDGFIEN
jgi:hypothetical protein